MQPRRGLAALIASVSLGSCLLAGPDGNRLAYLDDGPDPYHVGRDFPRLTTPQWVGEDGVEAVVILGIDDLTDNAPKYEAVLRPIMDRLKAIDGRASVSIMACRVDPQAPELPRWVKEGVSLEVHTLTHRHPLLQGGDFAEARRVVDGGIDLLGRVPGNRPVAFRMPYCDSQNTVSPRFFAEIFNAVRPGKPSLTIDSSVFNITTPADPALPRSLVLDPDGRERFRKYVPFRSFVNTVEDYPYPYVINRLCWEFPCAVPSDWQGQNLNKPNSPKTLEDLKAALDAVVLKRGVFNFVFHPHGWIKPEQVVALIDHAVKTHGNKVKFLTFREAQERIDRNLLGGQPLRTADGADNGVRLLDLDNDGYLDVVVGNPARRETRLWDPKANAWKLGPFPLDLAFRLGEAPGFRQIIPSGGARFGVVRPDGKASLIVKDDRADGVTVGAWSFDGAAWVEDRALLAGLDLDGDEFLTGFVGGLDLGVRLRDLDGDGCCELVLGNFRQQATFAWSPDRKRWVLLPFALPEPMRFVDTTRGGMVDAMGAPAGLRLVDLDEDGKLDLVYSGEDGYAVALFDSLKTGWSRPVKAGKGSDPDALPKLVRGRQDGGFFVHSRALCWQNEDTDKLPDLVDRRPFNELLKDVEPRGKSPEASRKSIRVRPGFKVELMAAEPLVRDPIAFEWGADGKLWVVEMGDYPLGADGKGKPGGEVKFLEDRDGDGRYDKATVFLDGLSFPTGVMPWRKGVLVACAPEIFYAEDTDGDGKADVRTPLLKGFVEGNPQHRVNGFDYGLDNWVYGANGDSGGAIHSERAGTETNLRGHDFRFRPDDGRFEPASGQSQFGRHRDDWGNWFGNNNSVWAWQVVLAEADLRRNPKVAYPIPQVVLDGEPRIFPISRVAARFNNPESAGRVTSANSPTPYRDELFGPGFAAALFVSEPVHNLVHRINLRPDGSALGGERAADEADRDFLASSDAWFRPAMLRTGPDGCLWIADMYRAVIEHPEWIPDDWEAKIDLRAGQDQGRIYRVVPVHESPRPIPRLDRLDAAGLVAALDGPNGWARDTAQRLLVQAGGRSAVDPLRRLVAESRRPKARVQALWTLEGLGALTPELLGPALADAHPEVRRNALRAGAGLLKDHPALGAAMARLVDDPDAGVRLAVAATLGDWDDPDAGRSLARLLRRDPGDAWIRAAVFSSAARQAATILAALFADAQAGPPAAEVVGPLVSLVGDRGDARDLDSLARAVTTPQDDGTFADWQFAAATALGESHARAIAPLKTAAGALIDQAEAPESRLKLAVRLIGVGGFDATTRDRLGLLLHPRTSPRIQEAALAALGRSTDAKVPEVVLAGWKGYTPTLRVEVLDVIMSRDTWAKELLASLEHTGIPPAQIDPAHRRRLLDHRDPGIRDRAAAVLSAGSDSRKEVLDRYRPGLARSGDPKAGLAAFKKACASCHRLDGVGVEVGPDLAALKDKAAEALLVAILDPNRAFEARYEGYSVEAKDGRLLSGLIAAESAGGVTLRLQEGKEETLPRAEIGGVAGSGRSLMPEGLENDLTPRDLADLIAYLSAGPGPVPNR